MYYLSFIMVEVYTYEDGDTDSIDCDDCLDYDETSEVWKVMTSNQRKKFKELVSKNEKKMRYIG